ncbi:MAG: TetR/AcrR family transcriptional regulator [Burkholderiaceae bacterium]|jgi:AcrR family transcriptional regulator|nr:TetR/AcrR family transcriptional regulator [Burkholderiaceae bacterium]
MPDMSLKEQQLRWREDAILLAVNRLLAQKGYDAMTVDEVASAVGLTKPSLYKHFASKEALAEAALVRLLDQTLVTIAAQASTQPAIERLRAVLRWALEQHLGGAMPLLPSTRSSLRDSLLKNGDYVDRLQAVSGALMQWIDEAQRDGALSAALPAEVILYTLYARTCDPVLEFLQAGGQYDDAQVVALVLATCFDGLRAR